MRTEEVDGRVKEKAENARDGKYRKLNISQS